MLESAGSPATILRCIRHYTYLLWFSFVPSTYIIIRTKVIHTVRPIGPHCNIFGNIGVGSNYHNTIVITIQDNIVAIPPAIVKRIFPI